jgi:hypothetical protein
VGGYLVGSCTSRFLFIDEQEMAEGLAIQPFEPGFWISWLCVAGPAQRWD